MKNDRLDEIYAMVRSKLESEGIDGRSKSRVRSGLINAPVSYRAKIRSDQVAVRGKVVHYNSISLIMLSVLKF